MSSRATAIAAATFCCAAPVVGIIGNLVWGSLGQAEDVRPLLHAGVFLVAVCALGFALGTASLLLDRRPRSLVALGLALAGLAANAAILYSFAPPIIGLYL